MDNNNFQNNNMQDMNNYGQQNYNQNTNPQQNMYNQQFNMGNQTAQQQQFNNGQGLQGLNGYNNGQTGYQTNGTTFENPYYNPNNIKHPRRSGFKWIVIGGLVAFVGLIILLISLVVGWLFPSYDIDDYDLVEEVAEDVLDIALEEIDEDYLEDAQDSYGKGLENLAMGMNYDDTSSMVVWIEYEEDDDADDQYEDAVEEMEEEYEDLEDTKGKGWSTNGRITEMWYVVEEDEDEDIEASKSRQAIIKKDNYILAFTIEGEDAKDVDKLYKEFLKELK